MEEDKTNKLNANCIQDKHEKLEAYKEEVDSILGIIPTRSSITIQQFARINEIYKIIEKQKEEIHYIFCSNNSLSRVKFLGKPLSTEFIGSNYKGLIDSLRKYHKLHMKIERTIDYTMKGSGPQENSMSEDISEKAEFTADEDYEKEKQYDEPQVCLEGM